MRLNKDTQYPHRVIICISLSYGSQREFLAGIFRHLDEGHNWQIEINQQRPPFTTESLRNAETNGVTGIIITDARNLELIPELITTSIPIVLLRGNTPLRNHPMNSRQDAIAYIHNDNHAIGRMGVRHFADCGTFASYGFIPEDRGIVWSDERLVAFADELAKDGFLTEVYRKDETTLDNWLRKLPKPAAIMCACDELALSVLNRCAQLKFRVPREIAVLGVDNDEIICRSAVPALSSVLPDHESMGYLAAQELERLMSGSCRQFPGNQIICEPKCVVQRESTGSIAPSAMLIDRIRKLIRDEATNGIKAKDLIARLGVSQRLAELRFRAVEGKTIAHALAERRLAVAKRLVETTSRPFVRIARECGFADAKHLTHAFTAAYGHSPRAHREKHGQGRRQE